MKSILLLSIFLLASCSPAPKGPQTIDDDYVLIEFASKLEEDYHRMNDSSEKPQSDKNSPAH